MEDLRNTPRKEESIVTAGVKHKCNCQIFKHFQNDTRKKIGSWAKTQKKMEVRDSRTGYLIPARDGTEALPHMDSSWDVAAAVSRKMSKYEEMHTFSKMGMSEISRNVNLAEIKAPAGAT